MLGTDTYRDIEDHPDAETFPGLYLYRFDAPLFFANASKLRDDIGDAVADPDAEITDVVIDAESMYDVDSTGAQILLELLDALDDDGIGLSFARLRTELRDEMEAAGVDQRLAGAGIYLEVDDAVEDYLTRSRGARPGSDPSTT